MEPGPVTQSTTAMLRRTNSDVAPVAAPVSGPGRGQGLEMDGAQSSCTTDDMASTPGIMVSAGWCYFLARFGGVIPGAAMSFAHADLRTSKIRACYP